MREEIEKQRTISAGVHSRGLAGTGSREREPEITERSREVGTPITSRASKEPIRGGLDLLSLDRCLLGEPASVKRASPKTQLVLGECHTKCQVHQDLDVSNSPSLIRQSPSATCFCPSHYSSRCTRFSHASPSQQSLPASSDLHSPSLEYASFTLVLLRMWASLRRRHLPNIPFELLRSKAHDFKLVQICLASVV